MQFRHVDPLQAMHSLRHERHAVSSHWWQYETHSSQKSCSQTRHHWVSSLLMTQPHSWQAMPSQLSSEMYGLSGL